GVGRVDARADGAGLLLSQARRVRAVACVSTRQGSRREPRRLNYFPAAPCSSASLRFAGSKLGSNSTAFLTAANALSLAPDAWYPLPSIICTRADLGFISPFSSSIEIASAVLFWFTS